MDLLELESGATPWAPTRWQCDLLAAEYRGDVFVLYDGVDTHRFDQPRGRPRSVAGRSIPQETRVVTFVSRCLERLRGFDRFMELANRLLRAGPDVLCIVAGEFIVQRGLDIEYYNQDYRAHVLSRTPPHDPGRCWFLGGADATVVAEVLAASDLHVYASRPYVVSRSLVEALAAGCVVLAADSEPVREFVAHGQTGLLVPPEDADAWERQARAVLHDPAGHRPLGAAAAALARERYARDVTLPALAARFDRLAAGGR
jgi:glycosyltransferase involved in cell wall biosynthesis